MQMFCWPRLVSFLPPQAACRLAGTARWNRDHLMTLTRKFRTRLLSLIGHRDTVSELQCTSEINAHTPFAREIIAGNINDVRFILELGINPNAKAHGPCCFACCVCCDVITSWATWSFYELAKVMATGSSPIAKYRHIEMLLREYGGNTTRTLCSRRLFYTRLTKRPLSCDLYRLFDKRVHCETFTEDDDYFEAEEERMTSYIDSDSEEDDEGGLARYIDSDSE